MVSFNVLLCFSLYFKDFHHFRIKKLFIHDHLTADLVQDLKHKDKYTDSETE